MHSLSTFLVCLLVVLVLLLTGKQLLSVSPGSLFSAADVELQGCTPLASEGATHVGNSVSQFNPNRLCYENQYIQSLNSSISEIAERMDQWLNEETSIEKRLRADPESVTHTHKRFEAFQAMAECNKTCLGGRCGADTSKQICGIESLKAPCVVYSIGGNNKWQFEQGVLEHTPCHVHTFDCTGGISRFNVPSHERLHFHYICLGDKNKPASETMGEIWTLDKMQTSLNHSRIDLLKMDIEGYEWPIFYDWPLLTEITSPNHVLPMQVAVEIHYQTQMKELAAETLEDYKFVTDMVHLHSRLLKMGYATAVYDANESCKHCVELSLVRIRCPSPPLLHESQSLCQDC